VFHLLIEVSQVVHLLIEVSQEVHLHNLFSSRDGDTNTFKACSTVLKKTGYQV
jgi:hypothetical protein